MPKTIRRRTTAEPIEVTLELGPDVEETFQFASVIPAGTLLDLGSIPEDKMVEEFEPFIRRISVGDTAERFAARMRDPENPIDIDLLMQVIEFLMESYSGRPTDGPNGSSVSPSPTGESSTVASPSPESTPML